MNINIIMQENKNNTLIDSIATCFEQKPKKVYLLCGTLKESGFKLIEEEMIDSTAKIFFAVGIDKKNTVRSMLETMLQYTSDVYVYPNNSDIEYESNIMIFEYINKVVVYSSSSNISEGGLKDNINIYSELIYDLNIKDEKDSYKKFIKEITSKIQKDMFRKINKSIIDELVDSKEIFSTKQYNHTVKSISELLGKSAKDSSEEERIKDDDIESKEIPKVDLSDIDIDFDFSDIQLDEDENKEYKKEEIENSNDNIILDEESIDSYEKDLEILGNVSEEIDEKDINYIDKDNELYDESLENLEFDENKTLDIENLLFSKADVKLDFDIPNKDSQEDSKEESFNEENDEIVQVKKVNLNNVTNLIFELPSKPSKGQDISNIKVPNYIKQMIPEFFGFNEDSKNVEMDGSIYKIRNINLEIIDAKTNQKYTDRDAKLIQKQGQSYLSFSTDKLKEITYNEDDIARIIKLADNVYHIEIISKELQEYKLWYKICNQKFKASSRKYGMM